MASGNNLSISGAANSNINVNHNNAGEVSQTIRNAGNVNKNGNTSVTTGDVSQSGDGNKVNDYSNSSNSKESNCILKKIIPAGDSAGMVKCENCEQLKQENEKLKKIVEERDITIKTIMNL